ncbi:putative DNA-binding WGR domain protein [Bradyrhizobium huanghuaihaiense]|uniref:WGR domain-containing protein n=1 Tax=Bradyrhizobium barranii subsp. barranii TaxID=2823807 RepID=A0A7Z0QLP8_9BRAD|nr:WGR domain-containing protein [Bradyrhizobium barranii]UGX89662.1 WGR domain-containing protein [Bradyrhizobium barranii subsp. barranii]
MPQLPPDPVHLRRTDAAPKYAVALPVPLQPRLFGGVAVVCNWGRIGTNDQTMMQSFDDRARAGEAFDRLERTRRRRGYAPAVENR